MDYSVRPYTEADRDAVHLICMATAEHRVRSETRRLFLLRTTCDYYLDNEPENCFVAEKTLEDGSSRVVGYIVCAADCERYAQRFRDRILPKIKEYSKMYARVARADVLMYGQFAMFFPAHLRLAVLPEDRRKGVGTALVEALTAHLRENRSKGVVVILNKKNSIGKTFFLQCGFSALRPIGSGFALGLDF
jgi:ribosomal protein S18 acetylase RimI-like enzyme